MILIDGAHRTLKGLYVRMPEWHLNPLSLFKDVFLALNTPFKDLPRLLNSDSLILRTIAKERLATGMDTSNFQNFPD